MIIKHQYSHQSGIWSDRGSDILLIRRLLWNFCPLHRVPIDCTILGLGDNCVHLLGRDRRHLWIYVRPREPGDGQRHQANERHGVDFYGSHGTKACLLSLCYDGGSL